MITDQINETKVCPHCGALLVYTDKTCMYCGTVFDQEEIALLSNKNRDLIRLQKNYSYWIATSLFLLLMMYFNNHFDNLLGDNVSVLIFTATLILIILWPWTFFLHLENIVNTKKHTNINSIIIQTVVICLIFLFFFFIVFDGQWFIYYFIALFQSLLLSPHLLLESILDKLFFWL